MAERIHDTLKQYIKNENTLDKKAEVGDLLCDLIDANKDNETDFKGLLQSIYRLLHTYDKWQVKISSKTFHKLIAVISTGQHSCRIVANILTCVLIYVNKFPIADSTLLVEELWFLCTNCERQPYAGQILVQLFDCFVKSLDKFVYSELLQNVIKQLISSEIREERRSAYYIMKRLTHEIAADNSNDNVALTTWGWSSQEKFEHGFSTYITILENLDENQSHLIIPSLNTIKYIENTTDVWQEWMIILYKKLLNHNNVLVLRWSLEYFLDHFTSSQLSDTLLMEFLIAANHTHLYNVEGYYLSEKKAKSFVEDADTSFIEAICQINWRSVALHYWLQQMKEVKKQSASMLLKLSSKVRVLQNCRLRLAAHNRLCELFKQSIDNLSLCDYIKFVEALHNVSDPYYDHSRFLEKLQKCEQNINVVTKITKRFYQIFINLYKINSCTMPSVMQYSELVHDELIKLLTDVPSHQHGWLRYLFVFDANQNENLLQFCRGKYDLDLTELGKNLSLKDMQHVLFEKLFVTKDETHFVRAKSVDLLMEHRMATWSTLIESGLDPIELLESGMETTFLKLCKLLGTHNGRVSDDILSALIHGIKKYLRHEELCQSAIHHMLDYAKKHLTAVEVEQHVNDILNTDLEHVGISGGVVNNYNLPISLFVRGLLLGEISTGDARIEAAYEERILSSVPRLMSVRSNYQKSNQQITTDLFDELLRINNELTIKKPRYFEHSKEHRVKIRIIYSILYMQQMQNLKYWSDDLWTALFALNNQLNISYLYELLIARNAPSIDVILEKLHNIASYTASQQVSLTSVIYMHTMLYWTQIKIEQLEDIVNILMPLTMGANFQIRLHAQLVIYRLVLECERTKIELTLGKALKHAIEQTFGDKLTDYLKEVRLKFPAFYKRSSLYCPDLILYVSNAPYDECAYWSIRSNFDKEFQHELDEARRNFSSKTKSITNSKVMASENELQFSKANVQRKMNPTNDILPPNDLVASAEKKDNEMFVVASLIDKLPNLGGIARTCEVLGIKNLVMDSKLHVEKSDFQNLSMTAEKSLSISEIKPGALADFLIQKQIDGFKIVGAEQTANSVSFVDFQFPAKCVLLLGHEKHGIPADLLGFLDYAVEIPQFGLVRSLNVHVTGALFMWEYVKQQLFDKS